MAGRSGRKNIPMKTKVLTELKKTPKGFIPTSLRDSLEKWAPKSETNTVNNLKKELERINTSKSRAVIKLIETRISMDKFIKTGRKAKQRVSIGELRMKLNSETNEVKRKKLNDKIQAILDEKRRKRNALL
jgi:hypothetical protein